MPRKGPAPRRVYPPDPIYKSVLVTQIVNKVMQRGKRTTAERIVYDAMTIIEQKTGAEPVSTAEAGRGQRPPPARGQEPAGRRRHLPGAHGGRPRRASTLAIRWLVGFSRDRRERTMAERLANELLDASNGIGAAMKRKEDLHKMAETNKAFAHYRW